MKKANKKHDGIQMAPARVGIVQYAVITSITTILLLVSIWMANPHVASDDEKKTVQKKYVSVLDCLITRSTCKKVIL